LFANGGLGFGEKSTEPGRLQLLKPALFVRIDGRRSDDRRHGLTALLSGQYRPPEFTGQRRSKLRYACVVGRKARQTFGCLDALGRIEFRRSIGRFAILQSHNQDGAETESAGRAKNRQRAT